MHRTNHLVDPAFVSRSPAYARPSHVVDNSNLPSLIAEHAVAAKPVAPRITYDDPVEYRYVEVVEVPFFSENHHVLFRAGGTD